MSDEIINELVNELYKDELAMINSAISKLKLKNDEFKKECIKLDEAAQKLNHAKKELSKEHQKLNKQFGIEKEEIKEEIQKPVPKSKPNNTKELINQNNKTIEELEEYINHYLSQK